MQDFSSVIDGVPADIYQSIMMAERRHYYGAAGRFEEFEERDKEGLFSEGRPGILASEMRTFSSEVREL